MTIDNIAVIRDARSTLERALAEDWPALQLSTEGKSFILGQVWSESRFGATADWGSSNNWGAVTYHLKDGKFLEHADHDANGKPVTYRFQAYDSQLEAARDYLRVFFRGGVPLALEHGSAHELAAAMYANHYYTGVVGTAEDRIAAYTSFVLQGAAFVEDALAVADGAPALATVEEIQERLTELGYDPGPLDGDDGPRTQAAVKAFQTDHGLVADGKVGPLTKRALRAG